MKTKDYILTTLVYSYIQFMVTLFIGNPRSLALYFSVLFLIFYSLYFRNVKTILYWVLAFFIPSIIFLVITFIIHTFFSNYTPEESIANILDDFFVMLFPILSFIMINISLFAWLDKKKKSDSYIKTMVFIYTITIYPYGFITELFIGVILSSRNTTTYFDMFLLYPSVFTYFFLPIILAIHAHINKNYGEKYIHILYMIFAPLIPIFLAVNGNSLFFLFIILVPYIPLLFVLKNLYLWHRQYKKEKKNKIKNKNSLTEDKV